MDIDFEECESVRVRYTNSDDEGNFIGFARLGENVLIIGITPGGEGELLCVTAEQAYSVHAAMERFEAGYDEIIKMAKDGLATREVIEE